MKKVIALYLILLILVISSCSNEQAISVDGVQRVKDWPGSFNISVDQKDYQLEIDRIFDTIDQYYSHRDRKGIKVQQLRENYSKRISSVNDKYQFYMLLLELFAELKNSHSNVFTGMDEYGLPIRCQLIEDRVVVTEIDDQLSSKLGIYKGWVIEKIDNKPADKWIENRFAVISGSTQQALWHQGLLWVFRRYEHEPNVRQYVMTDPAGQRIRFELELDDLYWGQNIFDLPFVETKEMDKYGYIAINTMEDGIVEYFDSALEDMLQKEGIIIDLRYNNGGNSANGEDILRRLIQTETPIWQNRTLKPYKDLNYSGEIIVLVGPGTYSAAESFAFNLHDSGRVTTMGEPTRGDSGGGPTLFRTDGDIYFRLPIRSVDHSASGKPMEGVGLKPHIEIKQLYNDLLNNKDTLLEKCREQNI